ncbi:MAG: DUF2099 family protein [Candidatus Methanomethylophilaceae archaeon]|nr:DUF2099 family protein [Candidatus Methanomethylophilaceae archaeon]
MKAVTGSHVVETAGARVAIDEDGIRIEAAVKGSTMFGCTEVCTEENVPKPGPRVKFCPVRSRLYGIQEETDETVIASIQQNIEEYGMYTPMRKLTDQGRTVSFGASEIIADAIADGLVDCAVMVCDGAGTVLLTNPDVVRAVGAHMTGLISTTPIQSTLDGLRAMGSIILDEEGSIDQLQGFGRAVEEGYHSIAVTIVGRENHLAHQIKTQAKGKNVDAHVFACHTTGVCGFSAEILAGFCDVVYACASRQVRHTIAPKAKLQMGSSVPVFGMTDAGKKLMLNSAARMDEPLLLVKERIPNLESDQPRPLL